MFIILVIIAKADKEEEESLAYLKVQSSAKVNDTITKSVNNYCVRDHWSVLCVRDHWSVLVITLALVHCIGFPGC